MANDISKIKLPGSTTEYTLKDGSAVANITRSGTTFTATKRDGTTFTFTQQDNNTTYTLGTNGNTVTLTPSSGSTQSITVPYATTSGTANTAKAVLTAGGDVIMGTTGSTSDDSGDIVWRYGNGNEKARLYTANEYTAKSGLNYRVYKKDGTSLYSGTIPLADGTGASGTWDISVSGNAATATKLATARSIALGSDLQGSANFDGSGNITISASSYHCSVNGGNKANYPWHRIAYVTGVSGTYTDKDAIFVIRRGYNDGDFGIIKVSLRTNNTNTACNMSAKWIIRSGFAVNDIVIAQWGVTGNAVYADIFLRCSTYPRTTVYQIYGSRSWTLINSNEVNDTTTTDKKTSTEVYVTVESAATEIHNQAYTRTDDATDNGTVNYANSAGSATDNTKLPLAGGTMTGAITFANGVKNMVGDDSAIGDCNIAGTLGLIGANGATGLAFFLKDTTWGSSGNYAKFSYDGTSMSLNKPFNIQGTNGSWLVTGKSPTVYVKKSSGSGALGAYGIDTKTGRFVLSTYPSSDDLVYFNWFSDATLVGTTNTVDKQFTWTPSTNTLSANISGTAAIANKLGSSNVGSATQPIYLNAGTATACTYTLGKSVPSDAVFTDTNTHRPIQVNGTEILGNNTTALNLKAGSNVSVTNSSGTVTIAATDSHRPIQINAAQFLDSNNIPFNIAAGSNITLVPDVGTATVVIKGTANNAVTQTNSTTNKDYRILLSNSDNDFDETSGSYKSSKLKFNPSTGALTCTGNIYTNSEGVFGTGIELGMYANDSLSFIDFHWNSTNTDWTARIVQRGENTVDLIGKNSSTWGIWRAASFSSQSSIHVKENVQSITAEDARKLLQLRPVTFNYKNGGQVDQAGLIAEEVNLVMPKMVIGDINFNPEEPWNAPSIDYSKFTPYLIKMVQEQQKEIDELRRLVQG